MAVDANSIKEPERRREQFVAWLTRAWDWAGDNNHPALANSIAEILTHVDELEYPLWYQAERLGITGPGWLAKDVQNAIGVPVDGPKASGWEREIYYSPIISLDLETWELIYRQLGWANRDADMKMNRRNFWLVSAQGNVVRFTVRPPVIPMEQDDAA